MKQEKYSKNKKEAYTKYLNPHEQQQKKVEMNHKYGNLSEEHQ